MPNATSTPTGVCIYSLLNCSKSGLFKHVFYFRVNWGFRIMADWDADDFEPDVPATVTVPKVTDKWDGEDEDDDVKVTPSIP